ncbi:hypothetical protein EGW08_012151, partial [Elysia chlorotica]
MLTAHVPIGQVLVLVIQQHGEPALQVSLVLGHHGEALVAEVQHEAEARVLAARAAAAVHAGIRPPVDVEARVKLDGALGRRARLELFLRVVVLEAGGARRTGGTQHEELFLQ